MRAAPAIDLTKELSVEPHARRAMLRARLRRSESVIEKVIAAARRADVRHAPGLPNEPLLVSLGR